MDYGDVTREGAIQQEYRATGRSLPAVETCKATSKYKTFILKGGKLYCGKGHGQCLAQVRCDLLSKSLEQKEEQEEEQKKYKAQYLV